MKAHRIIALLVAVVVTAWTSVAADAAKTKSVTKLPGTVQGLVLRGANAPATGARVTLRSGRRQRANGTRHVVTGPGGKYSMQVPQGRYLLTARKRGEGRAKVHVNVAAHQTQQVNLVLRSKHHRQHHPHTHVKVKSAK